MGAMNRLSRWTVNLTTERRAREMIRRLVEEPPRPVQDAEHIARRGPREDFCLELMVGSSEISAVSGADCITRRLHVRVHGHRVELSRPERTRVRTPVPRTARHLI